MSILAATNTENNRTGNGNYKPLKRRKEKEFDQDILDKKDRRMRFKNSKDPIYVAFEYIDKQPLKKLAIEFVKDSINDMIVFISKFN